MIVDGINGKPTEPSVFSDGEVYYTGNEKNNIVRSVTLCELALMNIKVTKDGKRYVQKGGRPRLYIDDAVITDKNNITVKEYLDKSKWYNMEVTLTDTVLAPDKKFAEMLAQRKLFSPPSVDEFATLKVTVTKKE